MVQMSHQSHRHSDNEHEFLLEDSTSFKEDDSDSDSNENADDKHTRSSKSTTSCQCDFPHVNILRRNNSSKLFILDNEDDDFPLLFGGSHGLESATAGVGESGPGLVFPVGGMRRVSSCYFSIASAASSTNNNDYFSCANGSSGGGAVCFPGGGATLCINNNNNNNLNSTTTSSVHNINNMDDFLLHDVLTNVFSYLDGRSLASFSETARRPNFECFYFLELQLQRALLVGDSHYYCGLSQGNGDDDDYDNTRVDEDNDASVQGDHREGNNNYGGLQNNNNGVIPSFEGSIAGTGVISRLASMDRESARRIVQTYLDSNTSIHAMPLRHSLAYFRQVLLRYKHHPPFALTSTSSQSPTSFPHGNIPENIAKMALFFTFLGAAYMHHQGGDAMMMPNIPGPSEVLNEENMEALKNMMLKVGLAGGFLKAGKTMKEKAEQQHANVSVSAASSSTNNDGVASANNDNDNDNRGVDEIGEVRVEVNNDNQAEGISDCHRRDRSVGTTVRSIGDANSTMSFAKDAEPSSQQHRRSVSIGSLEDLSHMMPNASAIALRLYNAFANGNIARQRSLMQSKDGSIYEDPKVNEPFQASILIENESNFSPKRRRRSKRSHKTLRPSEGDVEGNQFTSAIEGNMTSLLEEEYVDCSEDELTPFENEEELSEGKTSPSNAVAHIMEPPLSPSSVILHSTTTAEGENNPAVATSFFSFGGANQESMSSSPVEDGNVPTGCVGAYAHAVKTAATEVTRLVKKQHRANFERLSPEEQIELGVRFIDACTSDDKLHIVKEILQKQKKMDIDRFFIGPDDTETCALHAGE